MAAFEAIGKRWLCGDDPSVGRSVIRHFTENSVSQESTPPLYDGEAVRQYTDGQVFVDQSLPSPLRPAAAPLWDCNTRYGSARK